ncbi:small nuclear ribonucleoprotein [Metarhizium acridum CQMa 102]|uniref:LSM complex subunit LSM4 n=1 Tax=Metarhizium acridum (strain CQMa 102) TaxID=655827 RepID=E9EA65_METAQ|nr:small nuclear ribonucleoprotein [Metarhizium acridum CQMa 102]EFY87203.1 small nuclear ribonucleoprotein [Metarhizium acridum CQMa 102]
MLPLSLLNAAQGHPMLVELKNGETLNGHLVQCDTWMNLTLREVVQTSPVRLTVQSARDGQQREANIAQRGDKFVRLKEAYVKGNNVPPFPVLLRQQQALGPCTECG